MKRIIVDTPGGPEMMKVVEAQKPGPGPKEAVVKIAYSGVNFIDVYFRTGTYKAPLPLTPGMEGAGTVTAVGPGVSDVKVGDRVLFGKYAGQAVKVDGQEVMVMREEDIMGVLVA